ncbi:hypothetical protein GCM10022271_07440 [Corallibacter vietnamensis]|uniref:Uncharacterized protein n=1 Tax=Corallibacter vietnamensis TaxID=904130 RepID=A0ABP7GWR4_9FLAO
MRITLYLLTVFIILSCQEKTVNIKYYPTNEFSVEEDYLKLDLDTTSLNFKEITNLISENLYDNRKTIIEIQDGSTLKKIIPFSRSGCYFHEKNTLGVKLDSIRLYNATKYSIQELRPVLKKHYLDIHKNYPYSKFPQVPIIEVEIDTNRTGKELKSFLISITRTFDEIKTEVNDSIELTIFFNWFRQVPPPPKPPLKDMSKVIEIIEDD